MAVAFGSDYYILDMSGYGGGVEYVNVVIGKAALALIGGARRDVVTQNGTFAKTNVDAPAHRRTRPISA